MSARNPESVASDEPGRRRTPLTLAQAALGHDNNLNLLRVAAAMLVLVSHSVTVATGRADLEPGRSLLGLSLGDVAVDIFFVVSGFLVTGSLTRSNSLRKYAMARGLRIVPGLWVALVFTVLAVATSFSALPAGQVLSDPLTWRYLARNALIVTGADFNLPGAFAGNPFPRNVNASLWTLPLEVWMYIILAAEWWLAGRFLRRLGPAGLTRLLLGTAVFLMVAALGLALAGHPSNSTRHAAVFFSAAWMYAVRDRIPLKLVAAAAASAIVVGAALVSHGAFEIAYRLLLPYIVLYVAYVPAGFIRQYNRIGDFSYGVYIYAFPFQQIAAALFPGIGVWDLFFVAAGMTTVAAILSWYLVESPSLELRARLTHRR
jgi:peptidoglycan/LPS O-acetylase OafA/YrhL